GRASTCRHPSRRWLRRRGRARIAHGCSSVLSFPRCRLHPIEMAFEGIDMGLPEAPEWSKPGVDLPERLGPDLIDAALGFDPRLYEAGLAQHAQVLGHRRLRHPQPAL